MRLKAHSLLFLFLSVQLSVVAQRKVTIHEKHQSITTVLKKVEAQSGYIIGFSPTIFQDWPEVDLDYTRISVPELLDSLFAGLNFEYRLSGKTVIISRLPTYNGPLYTDLRGRVVDAAGEPLSGVDIQVDGTAVRTRTIDDGSFSVPVSGFYTPVTISYVGVGSKQFTLSNKFYHEHDLVLQPEAVNLNEVVVEGYGKTTSRLSTGTSYTMKSKDMENQNVSNVLGALQWQIPGLSIRRANGVAGSSYETMSRGRHSILQGNDPLYIVDGVPLPANSFIGVIGTGTSLGLNGASSLNGISPDNVNSVTVLNGADATAIYGSRAANGAILIDMKKGISRKLRLNADVSSGLIHTMNVSPLLNTQQFLQLRRDAVSNDGRLVNVSTVPELGWDTTHYTNFQRLVMGNAARAWNGRLALTGGGPTTYFLLSGNTHVQSTVFPGKTQDLRQSVYGYLHTSSSDGRWKTVVSGMYNWQQLLLPLEDLTTYIGLAPNIPDSLKNGLPLTPNTYQLGIYTLLGHVQSSWQWKPFLSVEGSLGFYRMGSAEEGVTGMDTNLSFNKYSSRIAEGLVRYSAAAGPGLLELVAGGTWQDERRDSMAINSGTLTKGRLDYDYSGWFGRGKYTVGDRYILTASGRRDRSSRFGGGNQMGNFYSLGWAWIFSEEAFLKGSKVFSYGKLRGNYGTTGNDQVLTLGNPDLRWELNRNAELGLDLGFLKEKLVFSLVAYRSWSGDQVLNKNLGSGIGLENLPVKVINDGLELVLRFNTGKAGGWQWSSRVNLTLPRNQLASYPGIAGSLYATSLVVGKPLSVSSGYHFMGVDPDSGIYRFKDINKDGRLSIKDFVTVPSTDPRIYGGWSNSLSYKQWRLDVVMVFCVQKGDNPLIVLDRLNPPGKQAFGQLSNGPVEWLDHWRRPGDRSGRQRLTSGFYPAAAAAQARYQSSDANVIDASYGRLKTVSLSWQLPEKLLPKFRLKGMQVYFRAQDLFTVTGYPVTDPETQNPTALPPSRSWTAGVSISI